MKLRLLIIPALMAGALLAQGPGGFGGRRGNASGAPTTPPSPPSPAQLAASELQMVARFLRLTAAQTSALTGNTALVADLTTEQTTLQNNNQTLKADSATEAAAIAAGTPVPSNITTDISNLNAANHAERVTAAGQILAALPGAGVTLTTAQATNLVRMLVSGGGGPGFRGGHF